MSEQQREPGLTADKIPVSLFREILVWPLTLHLRSAPTSPDAVLKAMTEATNAIKEPWLPVSDPSEHIPPPPSCCSEEQRRWKADCYAEGVYFHEFVRDFLFSIRPDFDRGAVDRAPFRLFRRADVTGVEVLLGENDGKKPSRKLEFIVERVNLYLFCTGVAVLVVEVRASGEVRITEGEGRDTRPLRLADVQDFHEQFRRAYVPFAVRSQEPPFLVVRHVTWIADKKACEFPIGCDAVRGMIDSYLTKCDKDETTGMLRRSPPLLEHWDFLLGGALPLAFSNAKPALASSNAEPDCGARWHHVVDERMQTITTISVSSRQQSRNSGHPDHYFRVTCDDDLVRLCYADSAGNGPASLYDARTLTEFKERHVYSTFHDQGTLFLVSGYAFVAYGAGEFFDNVLATYMRRHYFQIGLLAYLELATLLSFSSRISRAVAGFNPATDPEAAFERRMQVIEDEYLRFIHRFRFTGASNHLQAQELSALWRRHLRLGEIFEDLHTEITSATEYLFDRAASRGARTGERLTAIGTFGLLGALSFSFLGMSILVGPGDLASEFHLLLHLLQWIGLSPATPHYSPDSLRSTLGQVTAFMVVLGGFCGVGGWLLLCLRRMTEPAGRRIWSTRKRERLQPLLDFDQRIARILFNFALGLGIPAAVGVLWSVYLWLCVP